MNIIEAAKILKKGGTIHKKGYQNLHRLYIREEDFPLKEDGLNFITSESVLFIGRHYFSLEDLLSQEWESYKPKTDRRFRKK